MSKSLKKMGLVFMIFFCGLVALLITCIPFARILGISLSLLFPMVLVGLIYICFCIVLCVNSVWILPKTFSKDEGLFLY